MLDQAARAASAAIWAAKDVANVLRFVRSDMSENAPSATELRGEASRAKSLIGHMTNADEDGICRRVMIAACRIECVVVTG